MLVKDAGRRDSAIETSGTELETLEGDEVLIELEEGKETVTIGLQFDWLSDAKLILTDDLIAEMLRQKKADPAFDASAFDEIDETEGDEADVADETPVTKH